MALTALAIYKLLPRTNCRECGFATCMAFAMQVVAGRVTIDKCPTASEEAVRVLSAAAAPPLPKVMVGTGREELILGDETVLFRHEKTFYHPTVLALSLSDTLGEKRLSSRFSAIRALAFERVGQDLTVDMAAVRCDSGDPDRFARVSARARETLGKPLALLGPVPALEAALARVGETRPLLWAREEETIPAARLAAGRGLPLAVRGRALTGLRAALAAARAEGAKELLGDTLPASPARAVADAISIRRLAISGGDRELSVPTAFDLGGAFPSPFAAASLLIPKYGSLLVLDSADPAEILPLLTLRQNIFTDPARPIQVEPGVYPIGAAGESSPVAVTTNFSLTYFTVRGDIESSRVPTHLVVTDSDGMSVLTAWAAGKFSPEVIAKALAGFDLAGKVRHRTLVIPGLVARLSGRTEELTGWRVLVGPQESSALPAYLRRMPPDTLDPAFSAPVPADAR